MRSVLCLFILLILSGCGGDIRRKVEKGIAESLPDLIGPAKSYKVSVSGSTMQMLRNRISGIEIVGEGVALKNGVEVTRLDVSLKGVEFSPKSRTITKCESTVFSATLAQQELTQYLKKKYPDVPDLSVLLEDGCLSAAARPSLLGVTARVEAESGLKISSGCKLVLDLRKVTMAGLPAPGFAREYIEKKLNPIFDASKLGYDATISSVSIQRGRLVITGGLDMTKGR